MRIVKRGETFQTFEYIRRSYMKFVEICRWPNVEGSFKKDIYIYMIVIFGYIIYALIQTPTFLTGDMIWDERFSEYIPWRVESARLIAHGEFPFFTDKV